MNTYSISVNTLNEAMQSDNPPTVFDVRRKPAFDESPDMLPGAKWQIHDAVADWAGDLDRGTQIAVYCVHGHQVSQNAAQALRDMGFDAVYLEGGIDGWKQAGLPIPSAYPQG